AGALDVGAGEHPAARISPIAKSEVFILDILRLDGAARWSFQCPVSSSPPAENWRLATGNRIPETGNRGCFLGRPHSAPVVRRGCDAPRIQERREPGAD